MKIAPGILVKDYYGNETTIYPTGIEWLLAFAIKGCDWAIKAIDAIDAERRWNMNEKDTVKDILNALDEFLIYRTEGKLQELARLRNKLREDRQEEEKNKYAQAL